LFICSLLPARARKRRAHYRFAAGLFGILGFHVGAWAVQLAPLSAGLGLDPAALGATITVAAAAGLVTLFAGGALADRVGRRPVLAIGFTGAGTAFVLLALAGSFAILEVLQILAAGRSDQAIASQLVATLDTVKKHVSHILRKLGAANRTQAVTRARELSLIR
jgi:DNA-binding CsgD family transcriptional regulator